MRMLWFSLIVNSELDFAPLTNLVTWIRVSFEIGKAAYRTGILHSCGRIRQPVSGMYNDSLINESRSSRLSELVTGRISANPTGNQDHLLSRGRIGNLNPNPRLPDQLDQAIGLIGRGRRRWESTAQI